MASLLLQVYGIDLALVSNLVSTPVVNETIVKLSGTASQVNATSAPYCGVTPALLPQPAWIRKQPFNNDAQYPTHAHPQQCM